MGEEDGLAVGCDVKFKLTEEGDAVDILYGGEDVPQEIQEVPRKLVQKVVIPKEVKRELRRSDSEVSHNNADEFFQSFVDSRPTSRLSSRRRCTGCARPSRRSSTKSRPSAV